MNSTVFAPLKKNKEPFEVEKPNRSLHVRLMLSTLSTFNCPTSDIFEGAGKSQN